jgi:sorbitol-specific phosphotransferase system component IIA
VGRLQRSGKIDVAEPIPKDLAEAFAEAVLAYENWHPQSEGRQIPIAGQFFRIETVGDLVSKFTDPLPEHVFMQLRSYMHDHPHGDLITELERRPTYDVAGTCLRRMMERRRS